VLGGNGIVVHEKSIFNRIGSHCVQGKIDWSIGVGRKETGKFRRRSGGVD
jgi:hypothetical protein